MTEPRANKPIIAVVMGVSGSGKTTIAALAAHAFGCQFLEGDDLHPHKNIEKMHRGKALTDADRMPWLHKVAEEIDGWRSRGRSGVVTCSALARLPEHHHRRPQRMSRSSISEDLTSFTAACWAATSTSCPSPCSIASSPVWRTGGRRASYRRRYRRPSRRDRGQSRRGVTGSVSMSKPIEDYD